MSSFKGDVWIGTSLGILKGVSISRQETLNFLPSGLSLSQTDKSRETLCMCWEHGSKDQLYIGLRSGAVLAFDCQRNYFTAECNLTDRQSRFVGLAKHKNTLITCTNEGAVSFWPDGSAKSEINAGTNVDVMTASPDTHLLVATGGKENDLKLWDGNRCEASPTFKAKNVPHDYLDLRIPIWVTSIGIVPGRDERPLVAVGTGHHHLRLYDTRAKRRPVYSQLWEDSPITSLDVTSDGLYYLVGNSHGKIARIDLRKGGVLNRYHGFGGSVCSISSFSDDTHQVFAACGLDRYLRIYNVQPPSILYKTYTKLQCQAVLMSGIHDSVDKEDKECKGKESVKRERLCDEREDEREDESHDEDEVWDQMEVVKTKSKSKIKKLKLSSKIKHKHLKNK